MQLPYDPEDPVANRQGNKVFWKNLTITWEVCLTEAYNPGTTAPRKIRFGIIEARGMSINKDQLLYDPTNVGEINENNMPFNHTKVKSILDKTITMSQPGSFSGNGYKSCLNFKTFTKCNAMRYYDADNEAGVSAATKRRWYLFAIASDVPQQAGGADQYTQIATDVTFSYKDPS